MKIALITFIHEWCGKHGDDDDNEDDDGGGNDDDDDCGL